MEPVGIIEQLLGERFEQFGPVSFPDRIRLGYAREDLEKQEIARGKRRGGESLWLFRPITCRFSDHEKRSKLGKSRGMATRLYSLGLKTEASWS